MNTNNSNIKYKYAFDENHNLVNINDVIKEDRRQKKFYCISCGKELIPRLGNIRVKHFAHKSSEEASTCNKETYLHSLGKLLIKNKFDNEKAFNISFLKYCNCHNASQCSSFSPDTCKATYLHTVNLKKYYDKCECEKRIGDFVADVLLSSAKANVPEILIEIKCTHSCTEQKINSGYRIIEITVETEEELTKIVSDDLTESQYIVYYGFDRDGKNYLFEYTTKQIQQKFISSGTFNISFAKMFLCKENKQCPFYDEDYCVESKLCLYDIKKQYDHCEICEGNCTPFSLKFSKNGNLNQSPILIDLCCSAHCQIQKLSTEERTIRICFDSKDSFNKILSNNIVETEDKVQFFNFVRTAKNEFSSNTERSDINIFKLFANGNAHIDWNCTCHTIERLPNQPEIFKVAFMNDKYCRDDVYKICYALALKNGLQFKTCTLCKYRTEQSSDYPYNSPHFCCMSKKYGTPRFPQSSYSNECKYYTIDEELRKKAEDILETFKYQIKSIKPKKYVSSYVLARTQHSAYGTIDNKYLENRVLGTSHKGQHLFRYIYPMSELHYAISENFVKGKKYNDSSIVELDISGTNLNTEKAEKIGFYYMLKNDLGSKKCDSCIHRNSDECAEIKQCIDSQCIKYFKDYYYVHSLCIPNDIVINKIE